MYVPCTVGDVAYEFPVTAPRPAPPPIHLGTRREGGGRRRGGGEGRGVGEGEGTGGKAEDEGEEE